MRRVLCWIVLALAILLAAAGAYQGLHRDETALSGASSAGLGLVLLEKEQGLYVLAVTQDSPADRAGIHPGDYIIRAEDELLHEAAELDSFIDTGGSVLTLDLRREEQELQIRLPTR